LERQLKKAFTELVVAQRMPPERICEIYTLAIQAGGVQKVSEVAYDARIGSMPAGFAVSCERGVLVMVGYGEYGMGLSIALQRGVIRLLDAANDRAPEVFGVSEESDEATGPEPADGEADSEGDAEPADPTTTEDGSDEAGTAEGASGDDEPVGADGEDA
jgi:hypothetical protein